MITVGAGGIFAAGIIVGIVIAVFGAVGLVLNSKSKK